MASKVWRPIADGTYKGQHRDNTVIVEGEWLVVKDPEWNGGESATIALPDSIRVCELVDASPTVPSELIRRLLAYGIPLGATNADWKRWRDTVNAWLSLMREQHDRSPN